MRKALKVDILRLNQESVILPGTIGKALLEPKPVKNEQIKKEI